MSAVERLETARLVLDRPTEDDIPAIVEGAGDFEVSRWLGRVPHPYGPEDAAFFLREVVPHGFVVAIRLRGDGRLVGTIGLDPGEDGAAELGYWLARAAWGRGIATEAGRAVVAHAFGRLGLRRLTASVHEGNAASTRVVEKLGFTAVGHSTRSSAALGRSVPSVDYVASAPGA